MSDDYDNEEQDNLNSVAPYKDKPATPSLIGNVTQPFDNLSNNVSRTWDNFSNGNILHGLADTYALSKDPTGTWSGSATKHSSTPEPQFGPEHLNAPDKNGIQPLNEAGQAFLNAHAQQQAALPLNSTPLAIQQNGQSNSQPGAIGQAVNKSLIGSVLGMV